jgi:UDP-galactopyranose mutase
MKYDYLIVGSGFYGAVCARELTNKGFSCLVIDKRKHIGGNCYTRKEENGINIHEYGPHIFHTSNEDVWGWINKYASFNNFILTPIADYNGEIYSLPFNMWTFQQIYGSTTPLMAKLAIQHESKDIANEPTNFEEQAIKLVGKAVYKKLIYGYTKKQWGCDPKYLPKEIIQRLPVRFTYDNNYFNDKYQGIPIGGYTQIFEKLFEGIEVLKNVDYLKEKEFWNKTSHNVIYTGAIDAFYDYCFGELEYKSQKFEHILKYSDNFQGCAIKNFTDTETPYTRIIEHKHFEKIATKKTWITYETPIKYKAGEVEPMYPVNDVKNNSIYLQYKAKADKESNVYFGGRLAEYKYYDMHKVIESALNFVKTL